MPRESKVKKRERAIEFCARMDKLYPQPTPALDFSDPFQCVVAVALSAQTTDANVNKVTPELFARWGTPGKMAQADVDEVEKVIWTIGFHHNKARNCVNCARMIMSDFGGEVPQSMEELQKLPGVGRKTANIVMNECFDKVEGIAVDTHVFRIAHRLRFSAKKTPGRGRAGFALPVAEGAMEERQQPVDTLWQGILHRPQAPLCGLPLR